MRTTLRLASAVAAELALALVLAAHARAGDFNGDGADDLVIGVPGGRDATFDCGVAYVQFGSVGAGLTPASSQRLAPADDANSPPHDGMAFGAAVAAGDFDGDGVDDLAVGVPGEVAGGPVEPGAIALFRGVRAIGLSATANQIWFSWNLVPALESTPYGGLGGVLDA